MLTEAFHILQVNKTTINGRVMRHSESERFEEPSSSPMKPKPLCRPEVGSLANIQDLIRPKASNTLLMSSSDRSGWTDATYIRLKARASSASWSMMGCA